MTMMECRECKNQVSDQAKICPSCGFRLKPSAGQTLGKILLFLIALLFLFYFIGRNSPESRNSDACLAAQWAIKPVLKSPSSAVFPDCVFDADEYSVVFNLADDNVTVNGYVSADNSFGASLKKPFAVRLKMHGDIDEPINWTTDMIVFEGKTIGGK